MAVVEWLAVLCAVLLGLSVWLLLWHRQQAAATDERLWRSLQRSSRAAPLSPDLVTSLPEPARRYLEHAIAPGIPLASSVELALRGEARRTPSAPWLSFAAEKIISLPLGAVGYTTLWRGLLRLSVVDTYFDGLATQQVWLYYLIPLLRAEGLSLSRAVAGQVASEALCWLPSALLLGRGLSWQVQSADQLLVTPHFAGEALPLTLDLDERGGVRRVVGMRWSERDGHPELLSFTVDVEEEATFDGYSIPSRWQAGCSFGRAEVCLTHRVHVVHAKFR